MSQQFCRRLCAPHLAFGKPVEEAEENALWLIIITVLHFLCVSVLGC